jgi:hypothetical protein
MGTSSDSTQSVEQWRPVWSAGASWEELPAYRQQDDCRMSSPLTDSSLHRYERWLQTSSRVADRGDVAADEVPMREFQLGGGRWQLRTNSGRAV